MKICEIRTTPAVTVTANEAIWQAAAIMRDNCSFLPVVEEGQTAGDGKIAGIVSVANLAGFVPDASTAKSLERHAERMMPATPFVIPGQYLGYRAC